MPRQQRSLRARVSPLEAQPGAGGTQLPVPTVEVATSRASFSRVYLFRPETAVPVLVGKSPIYVFQALLPIASGSRDAALPRLITQQWHTFSMCLCLWGKTW